MESLTKLCKEYLEYIESDEYHSDNDWQHYIYEAALRAVIGHDVFSTISELHKMRVIRRKKAEIARLQSEIGE